MIKSTFLYSVPEKEYAVIAFTGLFLIRSPSDIWQVGNGDLSGLVSNSKKGTVSLTNLESL